MLFPEITSSAAASEETADSLNRRMTASTRVSESEFQELEKRALAAGKKLSTWIRDVLLEEVKRGNLSDLILTELLGLRLIVLNALVPMARGERIGSDEFNELLATIDGMKAQHADECIAAMRAAEERS